MGSLPRIFQAKAIVVYVNIFTVTRELACQHGQIVALFDDVSLDAYEGSPAFSSLQIHLRYVKDTDQTIRHIFVLCHFPVRCP